MYDSKNILLEDIRLINSASWMQQYMNCEHLIINRVTIRNQLNANNDGLDIDGCRRVLVRECEITWDFPDGVRPTTAIGLSGKSIADREISKHSFCSAKGVSGRCQAMMPPKTPCVGAFIGDPGRPSASPPPSPGVSTVLAVIPAPSRAAATVVSAPGSPGTATAARRLPPSGISRTVNA